MKKLAVVYQRITLRNHVDEEERSFARFVQDASWLPRPRRRCRPDLANQRIKTAGGADIIKKAHQNTYMDISRRVVDPMTAKYVRVTARLHSMEYDLQGGITVSVQYEQYLNYMSP